MAWSPITPQTWSYVLLDIVTKSFSHASHHHQSCSGPKFDDEGMNMLFHCCMSVIWGMYHVWQGWITPHITAWPSTTPWTYSAVTLDIESRHWTKTDKWCTGMDQPLSYGCSVNIVPQVQHPSSCISGGQLLSHNQLWLQVWNGSQRLKRRKI